MNLRKRTLALLLTVCLLLSVMVPMVSAVALPAANNTSLSTTLANNLFARSADVGLNRQQIAFKRSNSNNEDWVALKFTGKSAGFFTLSLMAKNAAATSCGKADLYFLQVPENEASLSDDEKKAYIEAGMTPQNYLGLFENPTANTALNFGEVQITAEDSKDFILVFKCLPNINQTNCYIQFSIMYQPKPLTVADATELSEAMTVCSGTTIGETVMLGADIAIDSLTVPANVTLDLNGHTLTVANLTLNGKLADNKDGDGLLQKAPGTGITTWPSDLLLYDNRDDYKGYRVYSGYSIEAHRGKLQSLDDGSKKLWINLNFTNPDAYNVIAAGNSLIEVGANLSWTPSGGTAEELSLTFEDSLVAEWGGKMADPEREGDYGLYVQFTGFEALPTGRLNLTPTVKGANTTTVVSAATIGYNHIVA